jgi:bacterioferritin-associated ferredoxin
MYVCICHGITEEMIRQASTHSSRPQEVIKRLGLGESCGVCITEAIETINATSPKSMFEKQNINLDKIPSSK